MVAGITGAFFVWEMIVIGGLTGVLSGLMGVGGAFILIPFLVAVGFEMGSAAALSLLYVTFTAGSGTVRHLRLGTVDPVLAFILLSGATPTVLVGAHYATILPNRSLQLIFAFLLAAATVGYLRWGRSGLPILEKEDWSNRVSNRWYIVKRQRRVGTEEVIFTINILWALLVGACLGFITGLLGVGGG